MNGVETVADVIFVIVHVIFMAIAVLLGLAFLKIDLDRNKSEEKGS